MQTFCVANGVYFIFVVSTFLLALKELDILNLKITPTMSHTTVAKVVVNTDGSVVFSLKNGIEVEV